MLRSVCNLFVNGLLGITLAITLQGCSRANISDTPEVSQFINQMVKDHNFDRNQLKTVFNHAQVRQEILDIIAKPAEKKPWYQYKPLFVTDLRAEEGVRYWNENAQYLKRAEQEYGVPADIIVAIIGVETRYGRNTGSYPVIDALTTLAFHDPKRPDFFRSELAEYLLLTREENVDPTKWKGSYAGAMGTPQFISSSYRKYAIDFTGHGHRDLFNDNGDAIGSVANYFHQHGWKKGEAVIYPVTAKHDGYKKLQNELSLDKSLADWKKMGIIAPKNLSDRTNAMLVSLQESPEREALWLGMNNFYVITRYNHSPLYAMAVYQLAEKIKTLRDKQG